MICIGFSVIVCYLKPQKYAWCSEVSKLRGCKRNNKERMERKWFVSELMMKYTVAAHW